MITEKDLLEAIAECQGQRNPTSTTCIKLAAYYTILNNIKEVADDEIRGTTEMLSMPYSRAETPITGDNLITYEFKDKALKSGLNGRTIEFLYEFIDDLMKALEFINPELYSFAVRKMQE